MNQGHVHVFKTKHKQKCGHVGRVGKINFVCKQKQLQNYATQNMQTETSEKKETFRRLDDTRYFENSEYINHVGI